MRYHLDLNTFILKQEELTFMQWKQFSFFLSIQCQQLYFYKTDNVKGQGMGLARSGFSNRGATQMASVRSSQKLPLSQIKTILAGFKLVDPPLVKAQLISDGGNTGGERSLCCSTFASRTCDLMGDSCWYGLKNYNPQKGSTLQHFIKNCSSWEGLTLESFIEDYFLQEKLHGRAGDECEKSEKLKKYMMN